MSEPRGKMPGVLAGVTKIMVARYVAPCGHRFTSRSAAKSHEAAATCWKLPAPRRRSKRAQRAKARGW